MNLALQTTYVPKLAIVQAVLGDSYVVPFCVVYYNPQ